MVGAFFFLLYCVALAGLGYAGRDIVPKSLHGLFVMPLVIAMANLIVQIVEVTR
jgi:hypothetical protein